MPMAAPPLWVIQESSLDAVIFELEPHPPIMAERDAEATNPTPAMKRTYLNTKMTRGTQNQHQNNNNRTEKEQNTKKPLYRHKLHPCSKKEGFLGVCWLN